MQLFEVQDVAHALNVSAASVRRYADDGKIIPAAMTPRGQRLFDPADVEKLRRERQSRKAS